MVRPLNPDVRFMNQVPEELVLPLDRAQIYRVLVNLMKNAAEAGAKTIGSATERESAMTQLRVTDDGPGLPLRVQDNLFKPFTSSGRYGGTGLGLAIARDLSVPMAAIWCSKKPARAARCSAWTLQAK